MKLFSIEGNHQHLDGGAMFGNAPKAMWEKWLPADEKNRIPLSCRGLLVQTDDGRNILFEAGIGAFFDPKMKERFGIEPEGDLLLESLKAVGVPENEIDAVVLSHLHFDHAGGLLSFYGTSPQKLNFPKAKYYIPKKHWEYAQHPHPREKASFIPELHVLLQQSGRMVLIESEEHPDLNFGVSFHYSHGHTIGLMLSQIELSSGPLVFVTDLIPGNPWVHLPITMGYDRYPELKVDEKKKLYESLVTKNAKLFFTHDPNTPCVLLKQNDKGKFFGEETKVSEL